MIIGITATGQGWDAQVDPRFGRCACFAIVDVDKMTIENIDNANVDASGGAGINSAQLVASKNVVAIITGNCGPNAFRTLQAAGINVLTGVSGTVKEAAEMFSSGKLKPAGGPSVGSDFGKT